MPYGKNNWEGKIGNYGRHPGTTISSRQNFTELVSSFSFVLTTDTMSKSAILLLAEGAEEMEAVITIDTLRRAGVNVTVAGLNGAGPVKCSRDVIIVPDMSLEDAVAKGPYDAVLLPGGLKGAEALGASSMVKDLLVKQQADRKIVGAICAVFEFLMNNQRIGGEAEVTC
ncbi:unnamed protein product, partial [Meganyctiphanes norvegica]